jgi:GTP-binding protein
VVLCRAWCGKEYNIEGTAVPMGDHEPRLDQAQFTHSAARLRDLPADRGREIGFAGRSNAGKSSLINALCGQTALARVSRTPGRTRTLNVFDLGGGRRLVDLPGYGYASARHAERDVWLALIAEYLGSRQSLCAVVWVMDARHPLHPTDLRFQHLIASADAPIHIALSKADKLGRGPQIRAAREVRARVEGIGLTVDVCSAHTGAGIVGLRGRVTRWLAGRQKVAPESFTGGVD